MLLNTPVQNPYGVGVGSGSGLGAWNAGTTYAVNDIVNYLGELYVNIQAGVGNVPSTAHAYWTLYNEQLPMYTGVDATDPASSTATETAKVDAYSGVIITLTAAGNAQTIGSPTDPTAGKRFTVVNNDTSTDTIEIDGIVLEVGHAQSWMWDGSAWTLATSTDADQITFSPATYYGSATDLQSAIDGFAPTAVKVAEANRALVPDSSLDISGLNDIGLTNDLLMATGSILSWNATDLMTHSANTMTLSGFTTWDFGAVATVDFDGAMNFTSAAGGFGFDGNVTAVGSFIIGSADLNETDLEKLDGITDGAGAANKALVLDGSLDISGIHDIGLTNDLLMATGSVLSFNATDLMTHSEHTMTLSGFTSWDFGVADVIIGATKKLYLDGGGDTYISETSANQLSFVVGGSEFIAINDDAQTISIYADSLELNMLGSMPHSFFRDGLILNGDENQPCYLYMNGDEGDEPNDRFRLSANVGNFSIANYNEYGTYQAIMSLDSSGTNSILGVNNIALRMGSSSFNLFAPSIIAQIGDPEMDGNGTYLAVDDGSTNITLEAIGVTSMGDPDGNNNNTYLAIDDGNQTITLTAGGSMDINSPIMTLGGGTVGLSIDNTSKVWKLGDWDGETNETYITVDDDAQTIALNATNVTVSDTLNTTELNVSGTINGVKVYRAILVQTGSSAPTATILENTLGGVPVWTRLGGGNYICTLAGAFPVSKTYCSISNIYNAFQGESILVTIDRADDNVVYTHTWGTASGADIDFDLGGDAENFYSPIEILVYP